MRKSFGLLLVLGIVLSSCVSTNVYDQSVPEDQRAAVRITGDYWDPLTVTRFDGDTVTWRGGHSIWSQTFYSIPEGFHSLTIAGKTTDNMGNVITFSNHNFDYYFMAGHNYDISTYAGSSFTGTFLLLRIKDLTTGEREETIIATF
jgi:hypothetical protein